MKIHYKAIIHSDCKEIDGLPAQIPVGSKVLCKLRDVQPLCNNCEKGSDEEVWYTTQIMPNTVDNNE